MRRIVIIFSVIGSLLFIAKQEAYGQLITDSDTRLKTEKKKDKGGGLFFFLKKNAGRSASGAQGPSASPAPRYSSGSPFASFNKRKAASSPRSVSGSRSSFFAKQRNKYPRYSTPGLANFSSGQGGGARYSPGKPFTWKDKIVTPRYSSGSPFQPSFFSQLFKPQGTFPRYSSGSPFGNTVSTVTPKYSKPSPFGNKLSTVSPRYSMGSPFGNKINTKVPRYSMGSPYEGQNWNWIKPRYSTHEDRFYVNYKLKNTPPEFMGDVEFKGYSKKQRKWYARMNSMANADVITGNLGTIKKPSAWRQDLRTYHSTDVLMNYLGPKTNAKKQMAWKQKLNKYHASDVLMNYLGPGVNAKKPPSWKQKLNAYYQSDMLSSFEGPIKLPLYWPQESLDEAEYTGDFKRNWVKRNSMHPSASYKNANQDSELIRNSLRKWNVLWTRVNRNKDQPDAVTDKISKPKFDRKEAEIWND